MVDNVRKNFDDYSCVFRLIKLAINNIEGSVDDLNVNWNNVFSLASKMSFVVLVKLGIDHLTGENKPEKEIQDLINKAYRSQILLDSNQIYELDLLMSAFENEKLDTLILKGVSLKKCYPDTYYRFMGDIDTFVNKADFDKADKLLSSLGYEEEHISSHDKGYKKEPYIVLEQHFTLVEDVSKEINDYYNDIWSKAKLKSGFSHIYEMTLEDIYIYLSVHAVHHIRFSGIAPRIFLDYYVFLEKYKDILNMNYINDVLAKFKYKEFDTIAVSLAYKWFSKNGSGLDKNSNVDLFVADCSTYGTTEHNVGLRTARLAKNGKKPSKLLFVMKQIFPPAVRIKSEFKILEKYPFLLPFVWVAYVAKKAINSNTKSYYSNINEKTASLYNSIITNLGLDNIE